MKKRFIDIGVNLNDLMFKGTYNGKIAHNSDLSSVISRASKYGILKMISTSGNLMAVSENLDIIKSHPNIYTTVGCHPSMCDDFEKHNQTYYLHQMSELLENNAVVAIGEFGLDYDRLNFCAKDKQLKYFELQFDLLKKRKLPLFLHSRNCHNDFIKILAKYQNLWQEKGAVVHSFTGTLKDARELLNLSPNLYIGINGCSLKSLENIEIVKNLPIQRILLETDAPWCEIKPSHASFPFVKTHFTTIKKEKYMPNNDNQDVLVKGRNEPCKIVQVFEVLKALCQDSEIEENRIAYEMGCIDEIIFNNTNKLFFSP